jgi:repressor LexA
MKQFSEIMKELRESKGLSQRDLAEKLKIGKSSISMYENGEREPSRERMEEIADFFNVDMDFLYGKTDVKRKYDLSKLEKKGRKIPVVGRVAAGIPIAAIEDTIDYEEISEDMALNGEYFGLKIKGDSMSPRILENDVVIVKKQTCVESGEIAIVLINGSDVTCKKVVKHEAGISLIPLNNCYAPVFYSCQEITSLPVAIIGKVVENRQKY